MSVHRFFLPGNLYFALEYCPDVIGGCIIVEVEIRGELEVKH